jgi:hypothetical protein
MICEYCNCDTYVVHIVESHDKICAQCYWKKKKDIVTSQLLSMSKKKPLSMPKEAVNILLGTKRLMD